MKQIHSDKNHDEEIESFCALSVRRSQLIRKLSETCKQQHPIKALWSSGMIRASGKIYKKFPTLGTSACARSRVRSPTEPLFFLLSFSFISHVNFFLISFLFVLSSFFLLLVLLSFIFWGDGLYYKDILICRFPFSFLFLMCVRGRVCFFLYFLLVT